MSSTVIGEPVQLVVLPKPNLDEASLNQLQRLVATNAIDNVFQFHLLSQDQTPLGPPPIDP